MFNNVVAISLTGFFHVHVELHVCLLCSLTLTTFNPSVHLLYLLLFPGCGQLVPVSSSHRTRGGNTLTGVQSITGTHKQPVTLSLTTRNSNEHK